MKYLAYNMLTFVNEILNSQELISKLSILYEEKSEHQSQDDVYMKLFENLLERILLLILKLSQQTAMDSQDMKKFHKVLLNKSFDLLERTINLLDSKQFINVVKRLIKHDLIQIRRRALVLLNNKLRKYEPSERDVSLLISAIDDLLDSIHLDPMEVDSQHEQVSHVDIEINNQTVLFCLKLLCKRIGEQNPLAFVKVIKYLSENLIDKSLYFKSAEAKSINNLNLLSSVLLCSGELCLKLKSNSLTYLNQIVSFDLDIVDFVRAKLEDALDLKKCDEDELIGEFEGK